MLVGLLIAAPAVGSLLAAVLEKRQKVVLTISAAIMLGQLAILVSAPVDLVLPQLDVTLGLSGISLVILLGLYFSLLVQVVFIHLRGQDQSLLPLALMVNMLISAAMLLSYHITPATLLLAMTLMFTVFSAKRHKATQASLEASLRLLVITALAVVAMLVAVLLLGSYASTHDPNTIRLVAAVLSVAIGILVAVFPLHWWLPKLLETASPMVMVWVISYTGVAALAVIISTIEAYPWLLSNEQAGSIARVSAAAAMVITAFLTLTADRLSRTIVYANLSSIGAIVIGVASLSDLGLAGASIALVGHMLATLLLLVSLELMAQRGIGGLIGLTIGGLAIAGLPPFGAFAGRWLILQSTSQEPALMVTLLISSALILLGFLRAVPWSEYLALVSEKSKQHTGSHALPIVLLISAALIGLGLYPTPLLSLINEAVGTFPM